MTSPRPSRVATLAPILDGAARGVARFPLTVLCGLVAAVAAILLEENIGPERTVERLLASAALGISLFTGLRMLGARLRWRPSLMWAVDALGVLILAGFFVGWAGWAEPLRFARMLQLAVVFHLFVAIAPYIVGPEGRGFWEYNRVLAERVVLAAIYAHVLYAGVALAVLALDKLFGVDVAASAYLRLWFLAAFLLSPWVFVAGLPADVAALERDDEYPLGLRAFTRFALLPIVAIYLFILLAYFVKVLVTWQWPSGWIGWLVSVVAAGGIFSLLLVHPLAMRSSDRWVGTYARLFYLALLPAIVMLWLAIWQRVAQYGITENRYFLIGLSVWLAGIAVYQLATRARGIRVIPASLCVMTLLTFAGPWSAYDVSTQSQTGRLAGILQRYDMLTEERIVPAVTEVAVEDRREIEAILTYLLRTHGLRSVAGWFPDSVRSGRGPLADGRPRQAAGRAARGVMALLALTPAEPESNIRGGFRYTARPSPVPLAIGDYRGLVRVDEWSARDPSAAGWSVRGDTAGPALVIWQDGVAVISFPLGDLVRALGVEGGARRTVDADRLRIDGLGRTNGVLYLTRIEGRVDGTRLAISQATGT
ncbi:MAG: DUF4153 domain-containing protein, partial [Gemmatimonadota bacterium]|nr:DUF4153 domain-containing protein [Gemmatimonadota bacterium]